MVNYEAVYEGANYLLDPGYGNFTGYRVPTGSLGATTSIQTANQLKEVTNLLNQGMKQTEVSIVDPNVFEMVPKGQLREINRLNKLVGAESSLHAPIIDPAGVTEQGWSEENREAAERQFSNIVERAQELDENGNIPVTIHASAALPGSMKIPDKKEGEILHTMIAVDQESGKAIPLKREEKFYQGFDKPVIREPLKELETANYSYWDNKLSELLFNKDRADELFENARKVMGEETQIIPGLSQMNKKAREEYVGSLSPEKRAAVNSYQNAESFLENSYLSMQTIFNQAYKYAGDERKKKLIETSVEFGKEIKELPRMGPQFSQKYSDLILDMKKITEGGAYETETGEIKEIKPIQMYVPVEDFAINKTSETLSNVALNAYKKFGTKAPIISVENPPYGGALSTGEDLKNLIVETREKFTKGLMSQGKGRGEAEKAAEKLIGATWDTSHISMIRKQGFGKEKIVEETKKIAPYVKHVHYNDNFGHTHTDLPPGMGDVPLKDVMNELNKENFGGKMVFEGGNFFQHFQTSPHPYVLEGSGSPLYATNGGPYWNQMTGGPAGYMSSMGDINPAIHHSLYGAGFSNLPAELGGNIPGTQSRTTGTPMA